MQGLVNFFRNFVGVIIFLKKVISIMKNKMISLGCIIPFYNERDRILSVIDKIILIEKISQIICVDDGSFDNASKLIRNEYPQIKVINLKKNIGKSGAVRKAVERLACEYVFLLDADIEDIKIAVINDAIEKIEHNPSIDMIIFDHKVRPHIFEIVARLIRTTVIFSGLRILKTKDLLKVFEQYDPRGFQLEMATNMYMQKEKKNVYWFSPFGINPVKVSKGNLFKGLINQIKMDREVLFRYVSFFEVLKLSFTFCTKKCP